MSKHVHKLRRHKYKTGSIIYFCVLDCNFKISPALAIGKTSICWICDLPFSMNDYSIRLARPHCPNCHKPKNKKELEELAIAPKIFNMEQVHAMSNNQPESDSLDSLRNRLSMGQEEVEEEGEI